MASISDFSSIEKKIINLNKASNIRKDNPKKKIAFISGCFDILHSGHAIMINRAKELADILVVGVGKDNVVRKLKGDSRPINNENDRIFLIAAMADVDYTLFNQDRLEDNEIDFRETLEELKPDIFVINDDNTRLQLNKKICDEHGIKCVVLKRLNVKGLSFKSTTDILKQLNSN